MPGDHVLLESEDFFEVRNPRQITIRATTATKESHDSLPFSLTSQHLIEISSKVGFKIIFSHMSRDNLVAIVVVPKPIELPIPNNEKN